MLRLARLACLLGAFAFAGPTFAQVIDSALPINAAVGTTLTISGSGFGVAKPKVQLFDSATNKKYALKVVDNTDTVIHATITKAVVADLTLQVIVKGVALPIEGPVAIQIKAPRVDSLSAPTAEPDAPLTVVGDFFGNKKGAIRIFGQNAKIVSWTMTEIQLLMPKKLPNGTFHIAVDSKIGVDDGTDIEVVGSLVKIGKAGINVSIDGQALKFKYNVGASTAQVIAAGGVSGTNPAKALFIGIPYNVLNLSPPFVITEDSFFFGFTYVETPKFKISDIGDPTKVPSSWVPQGGPGFTLTVNAESGGQISAEFSGYLTKVSGVNGPPTVFVEGSIIVDV